MTSPDRAEVLVAQFAQAVAAYRGPINRAVTLCVKIRIDGQDVRLPFFADMTAIDPAPDAIDSLDDIERDVIQALAEAVEPLTIDKLEEKSGHNRSEFYGRKDRLKRLTTEGIITNPVRRGYKLTAFGRDIAKTLEEL